MQKLRIRLPLIALLAFLGACSSELTFHVTRPPALPVGNIDNIVIGPFQDVADEEIGLPGNPNAGFSDSRNDLQPQVRQFTANSKAAEFIRSMVTAGLSGSGQYRLVNLDVQGQDSGGVRPDPTRTALVSANVKYYEFDAEGAEKVFYLLLATKGGLNLRDQAILLASKQAVIAAAERDRKGFQVDTPYIEKLAALEVAFDLTRQSSGEKIIETQRYRAYFTRKWGGDPDTSHLPQHLKRVIVAKYEKEQSLAQLLQSGAADLELALLDPDEYLARGGKLQSNRTVVINSLQIQAELAKQVVDQYLRQISRTTEQTVLEIASGDSIAVNYLKGNAYELAINRLEGIQRKAEDAYNLALAYESIAENNQAAKYYREALDKKPGSKTYQEALNRVRQNRAP